MHALVSALDWGFGHTTRSVALIHSLKNKGYQISVACTNAQKEFYFKYFPNIQYFLLPELNFKYSSFTALSILFQFPRLFRCLKSDKKITKAIVLENPEIDLIVSDNRYGFRNKEIKSILVCHQLTIQFPKFLNWTHPLFDNFYNRLLNRFNEIWIPDSEPPKNLTGKLSNPPECLKSKCKYIGILSRFQIYATMEKLPEQNLDYLFLISGIEKQRTLFENKILELINKLPTGSTYLIVRGLPSDKTKNTLPNSVNHLDDKKFIEAVKYSKTIIARAGYSTIMDLAYLGKQAILVPTPGQTEQEYLAKYLSEKERFQIIKQNDLEKFIF